MSQDVNQDWSQREFVESVEVSVRKCVSFLNHFQESTSYRLSLVDQRLTSLGRKLDYLEAQVKHSDPSTRGGKPLPFKKSVFDPETRRDLKTKAYELRRKPRGFTGRVIAPKKGKGAGMIISGGAASAKIRKVASPSPMAADDEKKDDSYAPKTTAAAATTPATATPASTSGGEGSVADPKSTAAPATTAAAASTSAETGEKPPGETAAPFPHGKRDDIDFRMVSAGSGPRPAPTSKVEISYSVYLSDGKCLIQHREEIALGINENIRGLEMGCCKMNTGMKAKLWVPFELGYGDTGIEGFIPPSADLTFDIEFIRIVEM
jgi:FKBP-type peptidyl-prolyl cis-trans isomerase